MARPPLTPAQIAAYQAAGVSTEAARPRDPNAAAVDYLLTELESRLSSLALRVRQPSWHEPPKGAVNVRWSINDDLAGGGAGGTASRRWGVRWNPTPEGATAGLPLAFSTLNLVDATPEAFDDGWCGIVWFQCTAGQVSSAFGAANVTRQARFSVLQQGGYVPGFLRAMPGGVAGIRQNPTTNATFIANDRVHTAVSMAPLIIRPNDTMEVVFHADEINVGVTVNFQFDVFGWKAPLQLVDKDIAAVRG